MTMKSKILICVGAILCIAAAKVVNNELSLPEAKVTARIIGEDGQPIAGAKVRFVFAGKYDEKQIVYVEGLTDGNGLFTGEGATTGQLGTDITKDGYYHGAVAVPTFTGVVGGRFQPWDATATTVLRKIVHPISMYAKNAWITIPEVDKPCGYDLEVGDWVAPYGQGKAADLVMILNRKYTDLETYDVSLHVSFSNPDDGVQETKLPEDWRGSHFKWPRQAPENGYLSTLFVRANRESRDNPSQNTENEGKPYYFRVRTILRDGQVMSALYGKMTKGFFLAPLASKTCKIQINYYLNPTPLDRNMEFDVKQNLFTGLKYEEQPRNP
jgi:hypothetical protein